MTLERTSTKPNPLKFEARNYDAKVTEQGVKFKRVHKANVLQGFAVIAITIGLAWAGSKFVEKKAEGFLN